VIKVSELSTNLCLMEKPAEALKAIEEFELELNNI
jgi:hypothetical protein